jgi:CRP-like cAMP-binding protein
MNISATQAQLTALHSVRIGCDSVKSPSLSTQQSPRQNHVLAALPAADYERLLPHLELVPLGLGQALYEPDIQQGYMYFPSNSIVSLINVMEDGSAAMTAVVGNEGVIGISLFMGGMAMPNYAVVQSAGYGYRLKGGLLKEEFKRGGPLRKLLLHYTQALISQVAQTAVCNRHHSIDQQLCRLLLLGLDRLRSNELNMTQELIANMLGVRREGITEAAHKLQHQGLIRYSRGHIAVLDRPRLEQAVCECYAVVKKEYDRLLADVTFSAFLKSSANPAHSKNRGYGLSPLLIDTAFVPRKRHIRKDDKKLANYVPA